MYKFYHVTPTRNIPSIKVNGLQARIGDRSSKLENIPGIYLFNTIHSVEDALSNWLGDEFDEDEQLALLQVTVPIEPTTSHYETVINDDIPPTAIKVLADDIDNFNFNIKETFKNYFLRTRI